MAFNTTVKSIADPVSGKAVVLSHRFFFSYRMNSVYWISLLAIGVVWLCIRYKKLGRLKNPSVPGPKG